MTPNAKTWLRENGYSDIAIVIETLEKSWKASGRKTRRDWWKVLAGRASGEPSVIAGITFPVVAAARARQGMAHVPHALGLPNEHAPAIREGGRWAKALAMNAAAE